MTFFGGAYFFYIAALLALPAVFLGVREKPLRLYGLFSSFVMIALALREEPVVLLPLLLYVLYEYALVRFFLAWKRKREKQNGRLTCFVLLAILPLLAWKLLAFCALPLLVIPGLSYMTFKSVQMVLEAEDGLIEESGFLDYIYFLIFFPCLSSGPIDRSRRFAADLRRVPERGEYLDLLGDGLWKIVLGLVYKFVIGAMLFQAMTWLGHKGTFFSMLIYMYSYGGYLFFDFAGYSLMAVGFSAVYGIRTPANFNKPFLATDMKDFWARWHMTLSYWFRDYVFSRFMMRAIRGKWFPGKLSAATCAFMINMGLMGLWHGFTLHYIFYGLYHGVLLSLTEIWQKKSAFHKHHKKDKIYKAVSWFLTMQFVFIGFLIFSGEWIRI